MNFRALSSRHPAPRVQRRVLTMVMREPLNHQRTTYKRQRLHPVRKDQGNRGYELPSISEEAILRQQAIAAAQQGHYSQAIAGLTSLLEQNPANAADYNNRGLMYFQSGEPEKALADYNQALQLNPRLASAYNNRANYYAAWGLLKEAIADYETAIDLDPTHLRARINLGITFRDLGTHDRAIEAFDLALQLSHTLCSASTLLEGHLYAERGRTYHQMGIWNAAIADYNRALNLLTQQPSSAITPSNRLQLQVEEWLIELLQQAG